MYLFFPLPRKARKILEKEDDSLYRFQAFTIHKSLEKEDILLYRSRLLILV